MSETIDISSGLLFPVVETLSPKLAWLKRHGLVCYYSDFNGESPETGEDIRPWTCARADAPQEVLFGKAGIGDTEDEACANYAAKHGLRLWNEEAGA
jgi:hypothetical protein